MKSSFGYTQVNYILIQLFMSIIKWFFLFFYSVFWFPDINIIFILLIFPSYFTIYLPAQMMNFLVYVYQAWASKQFLPCRLPPFVQQAKHSNGDYAI